MIFLNSTLDFTNLLFHAHDVILSPKPHSEIGTMPILWMNEVRLGKVSTLLQIFYLVSFGVRIQIQVF